VPLGLHAHRLWFVRGGGPSLADAERLAAMAHADSTDPMAAAAIGQVLSLQFGLWYLYAAAGNGSPVAHQEVLEILELAQLAFQYSRACCPPVSP
jgi:hypothetical protein